MQAIVKAELTTAEAHATIFDWAKKHTPTGHVKLHTPPRLAGPLVHALRTAAARVFKVSTGRLWHAHWRCSYPSTMCMAL